MHVIMGNPEQLLLQEQIDEELLAQALLDRFYAPLLRLAYSLTGDSATAEDIVQETLLVALDKIDQYEPGTDLKAWLSRIAIYTCRNTIRRRKLREKWHQVWTRVAAFGSPPRTPEQHTADHQLAGELWQAVGQLNDKHRLPLVLYHVHGMTAPEIAEVLGIKEGTVYSRLHYAGRKLAGEFINSDLELWAEELANE
jgi:RNA polymerase sigma-70 factor (ECF subfamily)